MSLTQEYVIAALSPSTLIAKTIYPLKYRQVSLEQLVSDYHKSNFQPSVFTTGVTFCFRIHSLLLQ